MGRTIRGGMALVGAILFLGAVTLLLLFVLSSVLGVSAPSTESSSVFDSADDSEEPLPLCKWEVLGADKGVLTEPEEEYGIDLNAAVMSENEDMALFVEAMPFEGDEECEDYISVNAPNFRVSPESYSLVATSEESKQLIFISSG